MSTKCQFGTVAAIGGLLTVVGAIFLGVWTELFDFVLRKQLELTPSSFSYDIWRDMPVPIYLDFYLFNWTNPEDITSPDINKRRPKLVEMGPYVYREQRKKRVLKWNDVNDTVTYYQHKSWVFEPGLSKGSEDDLITTLNVPAVTAVFAVRNSSQVLKRLLNLGMISLKTKLYVRKTFREIIFDGYRDPLVELGSLLPPEVIPITIPFDKFGWFYTRNNSELYDGHFNMYTGKGNMDNFGKMALWNHKNPTGVYESYCGMANGSAGEFFPPKPTRTAIDLFSTDICRTLTLTYKEDTVVDRIRAYRFWGDEHIFDNLTSRPDNWCFCPSGECPPHGTIDVSTCKWGAPAFISFPHFFHADPSYRESVVGMKPNEELHQMYLDLEERTGIPLQVEASMQINIQVKQYPEYRLFKSLPTVYFPVLWFKEKARIDDDLGSQIRLMQRMTVGGYIMFVAVLLTGLSVLIVVGAYYAKAKRGNTSEADLKLVLAHEQTNLHTDA